MTRSKKQKHDCAVLLKYMHMLDDGYSFRYISTTFGINSNRLKVLRAKYLLEGVTALQRKKNIKADFALKKKIVLDIENNHLTLHAASLKYDASTKRIEDWLKIYRQEGLEALVRAKKRGRPPGMGRPKKNSKPLTELERLQKENQELKTEIALLKKVRALVEERNARLKEIGRGSSKN